MRGGYRRRLALVLGLLVPQPVRAQEPPCPTLDSTAAWARVSRAWTSEAGLRWTHDSLRSVLLALRDRDQAARADFGTRATDTVYVQRLMKVDSVLGLEMAAILDRFGLPTRSMVGAAGADAAMLLVQHNWPLQERVLALAKKLSAGQVSPERLGMLEDRVLVHQGKPQRFGTQFTLGPDGLFQFAPADTVRLAARRAAAGMPPLPQYVCLLEEAGMRIDRASLPHMLRP